MMKLRPLIVINRGVAKRRRTVVHSRLVPRLTVGIFGGYWGILGDKKPFFLRIIKSLILIIIQSYAELRVQKKKAFLTIYRT